MSVLERVDCSPPFFLRDSRASETQARVKITPREKRRQTAGREKNDHFFSPRRVSSFLRWGDFHARLRFARSTIPKERWGTTRSLTKPWTPEIFMEFYCFARNKPIRREIAKPQTATAIISRFVVLKFARVSWTLLVSLA